MSKINKILLELLPVFIAVILLLFFNNELEVAIIAVLVIAVTFKIKHQRREVYLFLFGIVMGIFFEFIANFLLKQSWQEASFFAIPVWLPLTWGYGFVIIRRIGNIIVE